MGGDEDYLPRRAREQRAEKSLKRRPRKAARAGKPAVLEKKRPEKSETRKLIERGLNGDAGGGGLAFLIGNAVRTAKPRHMAVARDILYYLDRHNSPILNHCADTVIALAAFHEDFVRPPKEFEVAGDDAAKQLDQFLSHLFEKWPVPHWLRGPACGQDPRVIPWFIHLGVGKNLTTAPNMPFPLTKRMAHFAVTAPPPLHAYQAMRWGQLRGLNVPEELCHEIVHTRMAHELPDEPFWLTVGRWFALHPEVIGHAGIIVDYLYSRRVGDFEAPADPTYEMRGRAPDRLLADVRAWHRAVARSRHAPRKATWEKSGIPGYVPQPDAKPDGETTKITLADAEWAIVELLTSDELEEEGEALHHCVATYASQIISERAAIFSLRRRVQGVLRPLLTIEVWRAERQVVQVRGLQNRPPDEAEGKLIQRWLTAAGLGVIPEVFATRPQVRRARAINRRR